MSNLKFGEFWCWDESGIDAGHKTHMTLLNRVVSWLCQTFRNLRQIVAFTVPSMFMLDKTVRSLLHFYLETVSIDYKTKMCIIKPLHLQYNARSDKTYYHNLVYPNSEGTLDEVGFMAVPLPPPEFVRLYNEKKDRFTKQLNLQLQDMLQQQENKEKVHLTPRQTEILRLLESGMTSSGTIAKEMDILQGTVSTNFGYMRRKGVDIDKYLRKTEI